MKNPSEIIKIVERVALYDVEGLHVSEQSYGDSWKQRGGVGAFMMLARKWDRLEKQVEDKHYDIFKSAQLGKLGFDCLYKTGKVLCNCMKSVGKGNKKLIFESNKYTVTFDGTNGDYLEYEVGDNTRRRRRLLAHRRGGC